MKPPRVFAIVLVALASCAPSNAVTVFMSPVGGSGVKGTVVLKKAGIGTRATVSLSGLTPLSQPRALLNAGTCDRHGASFVLLPPIHADLSGNADATGEILFLGTGKVAFSDVADNGHVIRVIGLTEEACGSVPQR